MNYKINSKFNIKLYYLLLLIIILALIIHLYIVSFDIPFLDNNKVDKSLNSIEIVEPVHENSFDSDFTFVGNNLKDLDSLIINGNEDIALSKSNQIINLDDDNLSNQYIVINIEQGLNATQIATMLEANEICKKDDFINYVIDNNYDTQLQSGKYVIEKNSSVSEIVDSIISNDSTIVNIYPASTIEQIDNLLTSRQLIKSGEFLQACTQVCAEKGLAFVEGWFSPATYKISNDFDVKLLARTMLDNTLEILSPYLKDIANAGLSINEIIIIASLIQGETQDNQQMPIISSVIHNRLKKDMPLGIDATTRYEIGDWSGELTSDVLDEITPYNTRRQKGLPPSGICLSSSNALASAIFPKSTDFLYYIHDEAGNLITALTYDEHLKNIEERDNS